MITTETSRLIKQYFKNKSIQLLAVSDQAICEHNGLKGSHREDLIKIYLNDIIPKRFEIGQGMVYGQFNRSNETDIVLWDSFNFPNLKMNGHSMFFAESVNAVIEVKTNYNSVSEQNVSEKSKTVKQVIRQHRNTINSRIFNIEQQIESLRNGVEYEGYLSLSESIKTCAIFINGGENFTEEQLTKYEDLYVEWPDIVLFLKAGKLTVKSYDYEKETDFVRIYQSGEDSLLLFTKYLLEILSEQVVLIEGNLYFDDYIRNEIEEIPYTDFEYQSCRPYSGYRHAIFTEPIEEE
ncbi:DUF6602 domain-containing protein [Robertmurraya massiliosenegalensis]|uniref:DUF6602 domain-containing protein n=1 Tax=Robertmurraya TaxID=2837507 RepID=UPI0039A63DDC